jgi:hypothetical protein
MDEYIARTRITAPDTMQGGYNPGDPVSAYTVDAWDLTEDQVEPAAGYESPRPAEDSTNRREWERYVIGQGTSREEAESVSLDQLKGLYDPPEPPAWQQNDRAAGANRETGEGEVRRPAESAKKPDWVHYVVAGGGDEAWASDPSTTKDDLMAWELNSNA